MLLPEDAAKLTSLPLEIREKPAQEIINYVIDLVKASAPVSLFRTKLMVVGYEKVGKTSLLERLFPVTTTSLVTLSILSSSSTPAIAKEVPSYVTLKLVGKELRIISSSQTATAPISSSVTSVASPQPPEIPEIKTFQEKAVLFGSSAQFRKR